MNTREFCAKYGITATARRVDENPSMHDMPMGSSHWKVTLSLFDPGLARTRKRMTVPFSMGPGLSGAPKAAEVLDCLLSDASSYRNARDFSDWANELGFDPDSRKAEKIYRAVGRQTEKLEAFLGDLIDEALETERL